HAASTIAEGADQPPHNRPPVDRPTQYPKFRCEPAWGKSAQEGAMKRPRDQATLRGALRPRGPIQLALTTRRASEATVVTVTGELDILTARKLTPHLDDLVRRRSGDAVIDLSQAEFVDSFGLTVLLSTQRRLARQGRTLTVICGDGPVRRAIEFARLIEAFGVVASLEEYRLRRAGG